MTLYSVTINEKFLQETIDECRKENSTNIYQKLKKRFYIESNNKYCAGDDYFFTIYKIDLSNSDLSNLELKNLNIIDLTLRDAIVDQTKFINVKIGNGDLRGTNITKIEGNTFGLSIDTAKLSITPLDTPANERTRVNNILTVEKIQYDPCYIASSKGDISPIIKIKGENFKDLINEYLTDYIDNPIDFKSWYKKKNNLSNAEDLIIDFATYDFANFDFKNGNFAKCNFSRCNFLGARMSEANFEGSNFSHAVFNKDTEFTSTTSDHINNFTKCNFTAAYFIGANLANAKFIDCNFREAKLKDAILESGDFSNSIFDYANFGGAVEHRLSWLTKSKNSSANLKKANFTGCSFKGVKLQKGNLTEAKLIKASVNASFLDEATMPSVMASNITIKNSSARDVNLENADLSKAFISDSNLDNSNLKNANLTESVISNTSLRQVDAQRANFIKSDISADVTNADFREADLTNVNTKNIKFEGDIYGSKQIMWEMISDKLPTGLSKSLKPNHPPLLLGAKITSNLKTKTELDKTYQNQIDEQKDKSSGKKKELVSALIIDSAKAVKSNAKYIWNNFTEFSVTLGNKTNEIYKNYVNSPPSKNPLTIAAKKSILYTYDKLSEFGQNLGEESQKLSLTAVDYIVNELEKIGKATYKTTRFVNDQTQHLRKKAAKKIKEMKDYVLDKACEGASYALVKFFQMILPEWMIDQFSNASFNKFLWAGSSIVSGIFMSSAISTVLSFALPALAASVLSTIAAAVIVIPTATLVGAWATNVFYSERAKDEEELQKSTSDKVENNNVKTDHVENLKQERAKTKNQQQGI